MSDRVLGAGLNLPGTRGFHGSDEPRRQAGSVSVAQTLTGAQLRSADQPMVRRARGNRVQRNPAPLIAPPQKRGGGSGRNHGRRDDLSKLQEALAQLHRALSAFAELALPGGGAADFSRPSTDAGQPLRRLFPSQYANGKSAPSGADRPSARAISNAISSSTGDRDNKAGASDLFWLWGQFLDHDIDLSHTGEESMTVPVPPGDPAFDPDGKGDVSYDIHRSRSKPNLLGVDQQINSVTALIDASNVYGSTEEQTGTLRSFEGGRLKTDANGYLPTNDRGFFVAGDERVNENIALTSMHTLFLREHNRMADGIRELHPNWSDERIFQETRRWVTAQIQAITVNEFLPVLFGGDGIGDYRGPRHVDAQVSNAFAAAAYRFGHSMVSDSIERRNADGTLVGGEALALSDAFFRPDTFRETGPDAILRGLAGNVAQAMDPEIVDSLRNLVLEGPTAAPFDLAALNIARGRDHGLPTLNDARRALGMPAITSFDDPAFREGVGARMAQVYDSPEDIDLWIGLLAETPADDGLVGPTQRAILMDQFVRLRSGDRNWYENTFSRRQIAALNSNTLADVIRRNSNADGIQNRAMLAPGYV